MMTDQDIFDKVAQHLLTQNRRSLKSSGIHGISGIQCAYRGADGLKCAIGCLIPDELYTSEIEGCLVDTIGVINSLRPALGVEYVPYELLTSLQDCHDSYVVADWRHALERVAEKHNLSSEILEKLT